MDGAKRQPPFNRTNASKGPLYTNIDCPEVADQAERDMQS
jgi:hypothetical protein